MLVGDISCTCHVVKVWLVVGEGAKTTPRESQGILNLFTHG